MERTDKIYISIMFLLFYVGDLATTYYALNMGGYEANRFLSGIGFVGTVLAKTVYIAGIFIVFSVIAKYKDHDDWKRYNINPNILSSYISGAVCMVGIIAIGINMGYYA